MNPWTIIGWIILISMIGIFLLVLIDFIVYYYEEKELETRIKHKRFHD